MSLVRSAENPLIAPDKAHPWESKATFNPAALYLNGKVHILYRAMSEDNTSTMGYAASNDGVRLISRLPKPAYVPREPFEQKGRPDANSGCEDPRLTLLEDRVYMAYTAYEGKGPTRVALTSITLDDFLHQRWEWSAPQAISPPDVDDKDAFIFPEKVDGNYMIIHRIAGQMDYAFSETLESGSGHYIEEIRWIGPRKGMWDSLKVGAAGPPVKTSKGWIMLYHGVSDDRVYRVGALLLDLRNPVKVLGRTDDPILEPEMPYEKEGQVSNVVFPCGNVVIDDRLLVYYGGGDSVVAVATIAIDDLLRLFG